MTKVVLDSNIWDKLAADEDARLQVRTLCQWGELEVVVPDTLVRELNEGPFKGVPNWFPSSAIPDSVAVVGHSRVGHVRLGEGETFAKHRGSSQAIADAVLADVAETEAGVFVTEDGRARKRYAKIAGHDRAMDYSTFRATVLGLR